MNETTVELAALAWAEALGFDTALGADISPNGDTPLREDYVTWY